MAVLAIVFCVISMLLGAIFIVDRLARLDKQKRNALPDYSVVQSELVGLPNATNTGLLYTKNNLLQWLAKYPERRELNGLCLILEYDRITIPCIQTWVYKADNLTYPVEGSGRLYDKDFYKARNPRRRNLANYMLACINAELERRQ